MISLDAQIASVKTAAQKTESPTERAMLKAAVETLQEVKAERSRGQSAVREVTKILGGSNFRTRL